LSENEDELNMNGSDGSKITLKGSTEDLQRIKKALMDAESINAANQKLIEENSMLKTDLTEIAERELQKRRDKYDLPADATIEDVRRVEQEHATTAPLNDAQLGNPIRSNEGYDSVEDMIIDLNRKAKSENQVEAAQAQAVLIELAKKSMKKAPLNIELESNMRTIARKPKMLQTESKESFDKRVADWQKKQKWKQVTGSE
jgi:hypothetical protein